MPVTALLVHGETSDHQELRRCLESRGLVVAEAETGVRALAIAELEAPAIVIVESALPDMPGLEVCTRIARVLGAPTLLIGESREPAGDRLSVPPTDCVCPPLSDRDIAAHVERLLAAVHAREPDGTIAVRSGRALSLGDLSIDLRTNRVTVGERELRLPPTQVNLLRALMERSPRVTSPAALAARLWPRGGHDLSALADVIMELRLRLEDEPGKPERIVYVPDYGYRICPVSPQGNGKRLAESSAPPAHGAASL